jgi:hypothetical protein
MTQTVSDNWTFWQMFNTGPKHDVLFHNFSPIQNVLFDELVIGPKVDFAVSSTICAAILTT